MLSGTVALPQAMATLPSPGQQFPMHQSGPPSQGNRQSYDGGAGELATSVYRRDNTSTSQPGLPIVTLPKKKSAVPFILGMIALAAVGFSLVALIISYVQTGKLPWR